MKRYKYNMHHQWLTSLRIGELMPCFMQEVTPGDTWYGNSQQVVRMSPLDAPVYMSLSVFQQFFFVPYRQIWDEFEDEFTGQGSPTWPTINGTNSANVWSKFGVGLTGTRNLSLNALPIRAFNHIYNNFFKKDTISDYSLDDMSVKRIYFPTSDYYGGMLTDTEQGSPVTIDTSGASVAATTVLNAIRDQRVRQRRNDYGDDYIDILASYGVTPPDYIMDRPEHLASSKATMGISEVVATATSTSENTGEMKGHGITGMRTSFKPRYFEEHGIIVGVTYARPRLQLKYRIDKMWYTKDKSNMYEPEFSQDQHDNVYTDEVFCNSDNADAVMGYQSRFEHLRTARDTIAADFLTKTALDNFTAHVNLDTSAPSVDFLHQVQNYPHIFQDQGGTRSDLQVFCNHRIGKKSIIKPKRK